MSSNDGPRKHRQGVGFSTDRTLGYDAWLEPDGSTWEPITYPVFSSFEWVPAGGSRRLAEADRPCPRR